MDIDKYLLKILKYLYRYPNSTNAALSSKFPSRDITELLNNLANNEFIEIDNYYEYIDEIGFTKWRIVDSTTYKCSIKGNRYVESHHFFTLEYFLSHLLIPLIIGIFGAFVGALLTKWIN